MGVMLSDVVISNLHIIGRLTAGERGSLSYGSSGSQEANSGKASGITIKTVTRGFSTEADKLLNYLVNT